MVSESRKKRDAARKSKASQKLAAGPATEGSTGHAVERVEAPAQAPEVAEAEDSSERVVTGVLSSPSRSFTC